MKDWAWLTWGWCAKWQENGWSWLTNHVVSFQFNGTGHRSLKQWTLKSWTLRLYCVSKDYSGDQPKPMWKQVWSVCYNQVLVSHSLFHHWHKRFTWNMEFIQRVPWIVFLHERKYSLTFLRGNYLDFRHITSTGACDGHSVMCYKSYTAGGRCMCEM
jgi:hypothetical protein